MAKITIPIEDVDRELLLMDSKKYRLQLATYCRLILLQNLKNKSSPCAEIGTSAQGVLRLIEDDERRTF